MIDSVKSEFDSVINFIMQIDGLKNVFRQTKLIGGERFENDAEHSWHICMMAYALRDFFEDASIDTARAVKMLLLHDVVELYAGDTYCYNAAAGEDKFERELAAAERIFVALPETLSSEFMSLWLEFDKEETADAVFACIMDKIEPLILNFANNGESWIINGITRTQVMCRMEKALKNGPDVLKDYVLDIIESSVNRGYLKDE